MATGISESVIEEIKARTDLADLVASYGIQVKRAGSSAKACCPFHHEKTPSFNINSSKGFYHCFGCGESGDAIKFVQKQEGLTFVEAVKKLAAQCGIKVEEREDPEAGKRKRLYALMAELAEFYRRCLGAMKEAAVAREYLKGRALDGKAAEDWCIGYAPAGAAAIAKWCEKHGYTMEEAEAAGVVRAPNRPGDHGYHRFGGRLMFTIRDRQGRVVGFSGRQLVEDKRSGKYVNSPETLVFQKKRVLFGFDRAAAAIANSPHREAIVCEGQIDCIRLHLAGFANAVAGQGTAFTEDHVQMLRRVADSAVLVYDDDNAGRAATVKSARLLLAAGMPVRTISLPDGDDPDSFLRRHPADDFRRLVDDAESIVAFQCRAERAKEAHPDSIDAVARVTRAVVETIAQCPSAVIRASMVGEAAKLLRLPSAALDDELGKAMAARPVRGGSAAPESAPEPEEAPSAAPAEVEAPEAAVPPPPEREMAFMDFLMANEYDQTLEGAVGEFLPDEVFAHDFTRRFVGVWRDESAAGEDRFAAFADALPAPERRWFDRVMLAAGRTQASSFRPIDILQEFVRLLWIDRLRRERGNLAADGGAETDMERMRISMDLKRFQQAKWGTVKEMIRDKLTKGAS